MAVYRPTPICPFCGEPTARAIYHIPESWQPPIFGDSFSHWKDLGHTCKGLELMQEEIKKVSKR